MRSASRTAVVLAVAALLAAPAFAAGEAVWQSHASEQPSLVLDHGKKWPTDAALRRGMENIRAALDEGLEYVVLARIVTAEVNGIVHDCKLEPAADRQLHILLIDVLAGAEAMEGKAKGESPGAGAERVAKALNAYGEHFDHAGWEQR